MKRRQGLFAQSLRHITPNLFAQPLSANRWGDLTGALAGALASIPQTVAYGLILGAAFGASLSGTGALIALYGSVLVGLIGTLLGGCPFLVTGPRIAILLVLAALVAQLSHSAAFARLPDPGLAAWAVAGLATLGSGLLQILFGAFRLGRLTNYVPLPVILGFVNGTALLIILSQIWTATGIPPQKSAWALFSHWHEIKPATLLLAGATAVSVKLFGAITKRVPAILLAFVAGMVAYHLLAAAGYGPALGGTLTRPPAHFALHFAGSDFLALLSNPDAADLAPPILAAALSMSVLSTLDVLLAISALDGITMRRSNAGRQLIAEGFGNAVAGLFGMAPGGGTMARTQAALRGGMVSAATPIGIALITLLVAVALGPALAFISRAVMAGLLLALGASLLDAWTLAQLRKLFAKGGDVPAYGDLLTIAVVVGTTLLLNLSAAVGVGVLLSLVAFAMQMARTPIRRSYRATALIPRIFGDTARRRFIEQHGKDIAVIEVEGALFFGTAGELETAVETLTAEGVVHVVLDLRRVKHVDATGARCLERMNLKLSRQGGMLAISHVDRERRQSRGQFAGDDRRKRFAARNIWIKLAALGTITAIGTDRFVSDTDAAVELCEKHLTKTLAEDVAAYESVVARSPLTRNFDRPMWRRLRNYLTRVSYAPADVVFSQGGAPDGVFFIASGRADVMIDLPGTDRKRKVQVLTSGSIFGEMALIDPKPRSASIVAVEPTTCYWMSSANFERLKREQSDIAFALLSDVAMVFAERLRATNVMLAEMDA